MIDVVAGVIINNENKIFIAERNLKKSQGGLWEFPGGKIELGETREQAIERELKEELDITVKAEKYLGEKEFNYPNKDINLIAIKCKIISGTINLEEHEDAKWVNKDELKNFDFAPADMFIVNMINSKL